MKDREVNISIEEVGKEFGPGYQVSAASGKDSSFIVTNSPPVKDDKGRVLRAMFSIGVHEVGALPFYVSTAKKSLHEGIRDFLRKGGGGEASKDC